LLSFLLQPKRCFLLRLYTDVQFLLS